MEYVGVYPATVVSVVWMGGERAGAYTALTALALVLVLSWLVETAFPIAGEKTDRFQYRELVDSLRERIPPDARVVIVPIYLASTVVYETDIPCFYPIPIVSRKKDLWNRMPIPLLDLARLKREFGITHLVVRDDYLSDEEVKEACERSVERFRVAHFTIYELPENLDTSHAVSVG